MGLPVYVWKGQMPAIATFARENRDSLIDSGQWDGVGWPTDLGFPLNATGIIEEAIDAWATDGYPLIDWAAIAGRAAPWGPTVPDSTLIRVNSARPTVNSIVPTLCEMRHWLGRGSRISRAVPPRATLAIVGQYMIDNANSWNTEPIYA